MTAVCFPVCPPQPELEAKVRHVTNQGEERTRMKSLALMCLLVLGLSHGALAAQEGPLSSYLSHADSIYLVKVTSLQGNNATLSVTETLRGNHTSSLSLAVDYALKKDTEWVILSCASWRVGFHKDFVGDFLDGNCGWIYAPILREGNTIYVRGDATEAGHFVNDKKKDGTPWLKLDHFKQLIRDNPEKLSSQ